jgi:tripartite-type tricarboxylate transporter receptor subunit TctC
MKAMTQTRIKETLRVSLLALGVLLCTGFWFNAMAQSYPAKPLSFIVPYPAGGPTDVLGRVISQKLAELIGQPVVVSNRPGAGGNIGFEMVAKSPPDGYTILLGATSLAISPHLYDKLNYDPVRDFTPITLVTRMTNVLLVRPSLPVKNLREFVQLAKDKPGKLNFGSGGVGSSNHLMSELLKSIANIDIVHVPYKGASQAMLSLIGDYIDMVVIGTPTAVPQIKAGKVRALAVFSDNRLPEIPLVPTVAEEGFPGCEVHSWYGVLAPAGTPKEIVDRLNRDIVKAITAPDSRNRLTAVGFDPITNTPEQFSALIKAEVLRWGKVIRGANIRIKQDEI